MIQILLIAILSLLAQLVLPWWSLAPVAFLVCFWRGESVSRSFLYGFLGVALVWLGYALLIQGRTDGDFVGRVTALLFKSDNAIILTLTTVVLSGLVGGSSGIAGFLTRQATGNQMVNRSL